MAEPEKTFNHRGRTFGFVPNGDGSYDLVRLGDDGQWRVASGADSTAREAWLLACRKWPEYTRGSYE